MYAGVEIDVCGHDYVYTYMYAGMTTRVSNTLSECSQHSVANTVLPTLCSQHSFSFYIKRILLLFIYKQNREQVPQVPALFFVL